jgi:hypothetical protein
VLKFSTYINVAEWPISRPHARGASASDIARIRIRIGGSSLRAPNSPMAPNFRCSPGSTFDRCELHRLRRGCDRARVPDAEPVGALGLDGLGQATFKGLETSELSERLTLSTTWNRAIITVVSAYGESARSMSAGVQVRPLTRLRTVMTDSTSWLSSHSSTYSTKNQA